MNQSEHNQLTKKIVDCAYHVHKELGPGLLESIYEVCMCKELSERKMTFHRQMHLPVNYKGEDLNADFRIDFLIQENIVVELKAVETILPVHHAQVLTYLKLADKRLGILINFNVPLIKDGIKRFINGYFTQ